MKALKKINYVFDKRTKLECFVVLAMIIIGAALELLGVSAILPIVELGMDDKSIESSKVCCVIMSITGNKDPKTILLVLVVGVVLIYIVKNLFLAVSNSTIFSFSMKVRRKLATRMLSAYLKQPYAFFLQRNSSELIRSVNSDTMQFYEMLSNVFLVASSGLVSLCLIIYLFITNYVMTLVVLVLLGLCMGIIFFLITGKTRKLGKMNQTMQSLLIKALQQSFEGVKEIKVMSREQYFTDEYDALYKESANITRKYNINNLLPKYLIETVSIIAILGYLAFNILVNGNYASIIPQLAVFAVAAFRLLPSVNALYAYLNTIIYNMASVDLVYHDLKEAEELEQNKKVNSSSMIDTEAMQFHNQIELSHITFHYDNMNKNVLKDASAVLKKGQSVALIGASGGGKTTLADIFLGVLTPVSGKVLVDGYDIQENISGWTKNIGYIPQNIFLLDDTIRKNVAFGILENQIDDDKVLAALEKAQLKDFVIGLEHGLDTEVGERGTRLSGGQRQRLGIARALYDNPDILVFDEATSALDTNTEKEVMRAIDSLHGEKTMLIVAHRLSTIQNCDVVYRVENESISLADKESYEGK